MNGMNYTNNVFLAKELERTDLRNVYAFRKLSDEDKAEVERAFTRHANACRKTNMEPESLFLPELMADMRQGIHEPALMAAAA